MIQTGLAFCEVSFIRRALKTSRREDFFAREELAWVTGARQAIHLAGVLAAKKAFLQALGCPEFSRLSEIVVEFLSNGCPTLQVKSSTLKKILRGKKISLSISHTKNIATGLALVYLDRRR
ncbi:MAG: hypothetical protein NC911_11145 [Candidatus Omnitrophica bacterium]|nr:hypothetical protein [Candidatus Omnitrophota bacterium]